MALVVFMMTRNNDDDDSLKLPKEPPTFVTPEAQIAATVTFYIKSDCPQALRFIRVTAMNLYKQYDRQLAQAKAMAPEERFKAILQVEKDHATRILARLGELDACKPGTTIDGRSIPEFKNYLRNIANVLVKN